MNVYLDGLEKESINLIREVISTNSLDDICCFYSIGKDSSVLLKLVEKAFYPEKIKIPFCILIPVGSSKKCMNFGIKYHKK